MAVEVLYGGVGIEQTLFLEAIHIAEIGIVSVVGGGVEQTLCVVVYQLIRIAKGLHRDVWFPPSFLWPFL